jgi:Zn-dependent membrane protease YugP
MTVLGVILLILGFVLKISILWTIGIIVLIIGVVFFVLGSLGHAVGGHSTGTNRLAQDRSSAVQIGC